MSGAYAQHGGDEVLVDKPIAGLRSAWKGIGTGQTLAPLSRRRRFAVSGKEA